MFKKAERLSRAEFSQYFSIGTRKHFEHLTIITSPLKKYKVSVVVGKKVAKSAVVRNTIRRRIYARLRTEIKTHTNPGVYIIVVKPSYARLSRAAADEFLTASIAQVLKPA